MKITGLKPCAICNEKIVPIFYRVSVQMLMVDPVAVNEALGLNQMFGGNALKLAEVMSAGGTNVTKELNSGEALVCQDCFMKSKLALVLFEE